jgi:ArsR family transcriptional regulator, lead/cadmium/zinc/bismuth-responsive transcriptional repressor
LRIVTSCRDRPTSVGQTTERLAFSQSLVSHDLRLLRAARLPKAGRCCKHVFPSIADCHVREMLTNMIKHLTEPHEHDEDIGLEAGVTP